MTIGHFQTIYESEDFLCVECFVKRNYAEIDGSEPDYAARITAVHYDNGKIIAQKTSRIPWILIQANTLNGTGKTMSDEVWETKPSSFGALMSLVTH